jgi:hypothetical protein
MELANSILLQCTRCILWTFAKCIQVNVSWNAKYLDQCFFWEEVCRICLIGIAHEQRHLNNPNLQNPPVNFSCVQQQHKFIKTESWKYACVILLATLITLKDEKRIIPYGWKSEFIYQCVFGRDFCSFHSNSVIEMKKCCLRGHRAVCAVYRSENVPFVTKSCSDSMNVENILNFYGLAEFYEAFVGIRCF